MEHTLRWTFEGRDRQGKTVFPETQVTLSHVPSFPYISTDERGGGFNSGTTKNIKMWFPKADIGDSDPHSIIHGKLKLSGKHPFADALWAAEVWTLEEITITHVGEIDAEEPLLVVEMTYADCSCIQSPPRPVKFVELKTAYHWYCEQCGADNFALPMKAELTPEMREKTYREMHNLKEEWIPLPEGWDNFQMVQIPFFVRCSSCGMEFSTKDERWLPPNDDEVPPWHTETPPNPCVN